MKKYLTSLLATFAVVVIAFPIANLSNLSHAGSTQTGDWSVDSVGEVVKNGVRHVDVREALEVIENMPEIVIVDVRTPGEFAEGHIDGAINIDYYASDFRNNVRKLDPTKIYLVHCKTGVRSGRSVPIMLKEGIANIIHVDGGFDAWKKAGLPQVRG